MKQINLYQSEFRPPKILLPARALALSGLVFLVGLLALYAWGGWQLSRLRGQVEQVVQRADAVSRQVQAHAPGVRQADPTVAAEAQSLEARVRALQQAQDAIASGALGAEIGYSAQFRALARAVGNLASPGAWLTGITISDSGRAMDLHGRALTGADPARLIANLRREPLFVGLSFAGLEVVTPQPKKAPQQENQEVSKSLTAPRFLEFSLNARLIEPATGAIQKQGSAQ
jgi:hypothetical protein